MILTGTTKIKLKQFLCQTPVPCLVKTESGNFMPFKFVPGNFYLGHCKTGPHNENSMKSEDSAQV